MNIRKASTHIIATALIAGSLAGASTAFAADSQFIGSLVYRTGPYAPGGIPWADGFADYINLLNERDGGINGVKLSLEECDTAYNTDKGVECYERLKNKGSTGMPAVMPLSTGITYALLDRVVADKIPLITSGYGRADAADGRIFPYVFVPPATYWGGADIAINYVASQEGGYGKLKGKKIALVYHDSAYGKEPIRTLEALASEHGFKFSKFPVPHPGLEQKATWLKIGRQLRPDYVLMWGWGVMNATAIKEAAAVGFPRDKFIGVWWSGNDADMIPAGKAAKGYKSLQFNGVGSDFGVHQQIKNELYAKGKGSAKSAEQTGEVAYNRGLQSALILTEALQAAMNHYGNKPVTGEQVAWALDRLSITEDRLKEIGADGLFDPIELSCVDHLGKGRAKVTQWDGKQWKAISDWISPNSKMLRAMYEASAAQYAKEKGITPRPCG
ncbi:MAG: ABC transporter substrate-binding protein [Gammaproteobacteria bacterium]|nr:ABC transporter substrate-binding protein [Gammaproteobacteria bacterium]